MAEGNDLREQLRFLEALRRRLDRVEREQEEGGGGVRLLRPEGQGEVDNNDNRQEEDEEEAYIPPLNENGDERMVEDNESDEDSSDSHSSMLSLEENERIQIQEDAAEDHNQAPRELTFPLVSDFKENVSVARHLYLLSSDPTQKMTQIVSIRFQDLSTMQIKDACMKNETNESAKIIEGNFRPLRNYLLGKQKGKDKSDTSLSIFTARMSNQSICYALKLDIGLLQTLSKSLKNATILATLKILGSQSQSPEYNFASEAKVADILKKPQSFMSFSDYYVDYDLLTLEHTRNGNLRFSLQVSVKCSNVRFERIPLKLAEGSSSSVLQSMWQLEDSLKDVTIVACGGAEIKCHRNVLIVQSPSFYSMLNPEYEMAEARSGRIHMEGNSEEGLRQFLQFLYGFEILVGSITPDLALEVFQLANKYEVKALEDFLKDFFSEKGMDWWTTDALMELYIYVRNIESLEVLMALALTEMSTLATEKIESCEYFKTLSREDALSLVLKLLEWK